MIKFTVKGKPKTLKRHRKGKGGMYDPSAGDKVLFVSSCRKYAPAVPLAFPLKVYLQFHFDNKKNEPDIDNLIKFVFDAGNKIFWLDDKYITQVVAVKCFDGNARTEVVISEADNG